MRPQRRYASTIIAVVSILLFGQCSSPEPAGWDALPEVLRLISPPVFPDREFSVRSFGAVSDGTFDCTSAFRSAIDSCSAAGGGKVMVPPGRYLTGAIHLKNNVNLVVDSGATILFSTDPNAYLPVVYTRWEGVECMNYSPLIYAYGQTNIAVTGRGTLDGQGSSASWWPWKGSTQFGWTKGMPNQKKARAALLEMADDNIPVSQRVFGDGSYLRPNFIQPYNCTNVLIEGVTFRNSPMWFIHPVLCSNVTISGVTVEGLGPNNDGCDPESSRDVLIDNCSFTTGDDCIAIKSGRNTDGRRVNVPSQNLVVQNCRMRDGHGGVVIGSEMSGGVRNVFVQKCSMDSPNLDRALRIKTNAVRGGFVDNILMRDVTIGEVSEAVLKINFYYEEGDQGSFIPVVRGVHLENVTSRKSAYGVWIRAFPNSPAKDVTLSHCTFDSVAHGNVVEHAAELDLSDVRMNGELLTTDALIH